MPFFIVSGKRTTDNKNTRLFANKRILACRIAFLIKLLANQRIEKPGHVHSGSV